MLVVPLDSRKAIVLQIFYPTIMKFFLVMFLVLLSLTYADTIVTSCSFTSINDLLDEADRNLLNLSATITSCPNICGLAWGTGSPDLSGIGVNISYKAQAALTVLCGPLLYLISTLRYQFRLDKRTLDYLSDIYESVVNISIGINLPVAIAALYCINQYPPFFDQTFSADLLDMQLSSFVVLVSTAPLLNELGVKHSNITVLCLAIQFSLWVIAETLVTVNIARWMSVEELVEDCKGYNQVTPFLIQTMKQSFRESKFKSLTWSWGVFVVIQFYLICSIFAFKTSRCFVLKIVVTCLQWPLRHRLRWRKRRWIRLVVAGVMVPLTVSMTYFMLYQTWLQESMRSNLRAITGDYCDDQWSFGQIIAVCIWVPPCLKIVYYLTSVIMQWMVPEFIINDMWYGSEMNLEVWIHDFLEFISKIHRFEDDTDENIV